MIKIHNNIMCDYISKKVTFHKIRYQLIYFLIDNKSIKPICKNLFLLKN